MIRRQSAHFALNLPQHCRRLAANTMRSTLILLGIALLSAQSYAVCTAKALSVQGLIQTYPDLTILRGSLTRGSGGTVFHAEKLIRGQAGLGDYSVVAQWHDETCQLYEDSTPMSYPADGVLMSGEWAQYLLVYKIDTARRILYVPDNYHYGLAVVENQKVLQSRRNIDGRYQYLPAGNFEAGIRATPVNLPWQPVTLAPE